MPSIYALLTAALAVVAHAAVIDIEIHEDGHFQVGHEAVLSSTSRAPKLHNFFRPEDKNDYVQCGIYPEGADKQEVSEMMKQLNTPQYNLIREHHFLALACSYDGKAVIGINNPRDTDVVLSEREARDAAREVTKQCHEKNDQQDEINGAFVFFKDVKLEIRTWDFPGETCVDGREYSEQPN